jgi:drug/metabolite transporter (DMT)-like permease
VGADAAGGSAADRRIAEVGVLLVMVLWSANYVIVKSALVAAPPAGFNLLRLIVGAVALLVALRVREGTIALPRRDLVSLALLGFVGFTLYQVLWGTALLTTTAGDSALIIGAAPALIALFAVAIGSDRLTWTKGLGALVALAGVALVVTAGTGIHLGAAGLGDLLTLGAAASWALYIAVGTPLFRRVSPIASAAWAVTFGALWLAPLGGAEVISAPSVYLQPGVIVALLYSGLLAVALSQVLVMRAIPVLGPMRFANFQFLMPPLTVVLGAVVLGEPIHAGQVVGGAVIIAGILLARRDASVAFRARARGPA